jgi:hypothetical protein
MGYLTLVLGLTLLAVFTWLLIRNGKRSGFIHRLFSIDIILGIAAGLYLIASSVYSILIH